MKKGRLLALNTVMAPYRVNLFEEIGRRFELVGCFEQKSDQSRDDAWYEDETVNFERIALAGWERGGLHPRFDVIRKVREFEPELVLVFEYSTVTAALLMTYCIAKRIPYLINCDGAFVSDHPLKNAVKRHFIGRAAGCLASGKSARDYFLHFGAREENIHLHNFTTLYEKDILTQTVSVEEKERLKTEAGLNRGRVFLSVGSFIHRKGFDLLFEAIKRAGIGERDNVSFVIIGGGERWPEYDEFVRSNELAFVKLLPFMGKDELQKYYDASDVFILPTREDIWGLVVNEAMARGLPIISSDHCNAGLELVTHGANGHIVRSESVDDLVKVIGKYASLSHEELRAMGEKSLSIISEYTMENMTHSIASTIKNVLERCDKGGLRS